MNANTVKVLDAVRYMGATTAMGLITQTGLPGDEVRAALNDLTARKAVESKRVGDAVKYVTK